MAELSLAPTVTKLTKSQRDFLFAPEVFSVIEGGFGCLAAETLINDVPVAEMGCDFVPTLLGRVRPERPVLLGRSDLYEVRTLSGFRVSVTLDHRFLSRAGWRRLRDLRVGDVIAADGSSHEFHDSQRRSDSRDSRSSSLHPNDVSLRPEAVAFLSKWRQLRTRDGGNSAWELDDLLSIGNYARLLLREDAELLQRVLADDELLRAVLESLEALPDSWPQFPCRSPQIGSGRLFLDWELEVSPALPSFEAHGFRNLSVRSRERRVHSSRTHEPPPRLFPIGKTALVDAFGRTILAGHDSQVHYSSFWDQIVEIRFVGNGQFYDFTVPVAHHYAAQGLIHSNCGKTFVGCLKGLILSKEIPGNVGIIGRYHGTDLADSTIPTFFEVCPPSWIRSYNKDRNVLTLRNGSVILFRHIHDDKASAKGKKSRRVGANLGWFFIDQLEECSIDHWNTLVSRLRLPRAPKKFGFGAANPNGHDWLYRHFFEEQYREFKEGELSFSCRSRNGLGIAVKSDENRVSNGGFVADEDFDNMRTQMSPEWIARYLDCSFEEFAGKIYKDYYLGSVHNIVPFTIPNEWPSAYSIDVGGAAPWSVGGYRIDPQKNIILTNLFHKPGVNAAEVAAWIRGRVRLQDPRTLGVIDYENKLAMLELNQLLRSALRPAMKKVQPGVIQVGGMMWVNPLMPLPSWYEETQPKERIQRFSGGGSPQIFVFESVECEPFRKELDGYVWDDNGKDPRKENDHGPDQLRYLVTTLPKNMTARAAPMTPQEVKRKKLQRTDPASGREANHIEKHFRERAEAQAPASALREVLSDDDESPEDEMVASFNRRDYDLEEED